MSCSFGWNSSILSNIIFKAYYRIVCSTMSSNNWSLSSSMITLCTITHVTRISLMVLRTHWQFGFWIIFQFDCRILKQRSTSLHETSCIWHSIVVSLMEDCGFFLSRNSPGGCTPYDYISHVQSKFATPISYAIDNFLNHDIFFYIYITIGSIFSMFFWNF